jgi:aromatase
VAAPSATAYDLVADVAAWPQVFGPTVHVEVVEHKASDTGAEQLLRIWALAHDQVRSWTSRRVLNAAAGTVSFQQVVSARPVAAMSGEWRIVPVDDRTTRVLLLHQYRAVDDDANAEELIEQAINRNSNAELAALKDAAELGASGAGLRFTFSDSVTVASSADVVYSFLERADLWPERLPHVSRLELSEDAPGIQRMDMDTRSPDGSVHNTVSVRVCFEDRRVIVYKQLRMPAVMSGHTGRWVVEERDDGSVKATSWHTVTLDPEGVRAALGPRATLDQARELVRKALSANSSLTLQHASRFAEDTRVGP